jgi:hypothetical protein
LFHENAQDIFTEEYQAAAFADLTKPENVALAIHGKLTQ